MINLRSAKDKDRSILSDTCISVAPLYEEFMPNAFKNQAEKFMERGLSTSYDTVIIENDNDEIGFVGTKKLNEHIVYLVACYIHSDFQNKGLGSLGIKYLKNSLKELHTKEIVLLVHKKAVWAQQFYLKNGFVIVSYDKDQILSYDNGIMENDYLDNTVLMSHKLIY